MSTAASVVMTDVLEKRRLRNLIAKRKYRETHRERLKISDREAQRRRRKWKLHLLNKYGLTLETFQDLLYAYQGCCGICKKQVPLELHIDHDHKTGKVRGLLCKKCNTGLGNFEDSTILLERAKQYLSS